MSKDQARRKRKVAEGNGDGTGLSNDVIDIQAKLEGGYVNEVTSRKGRNYKSLKQLAGSENFELLPPEVPTYYNIDSPPSTLPPKKYCDLTGFKANYTDPKTGLRFCSPEAFRFLRSLPEHRVQDFLSLRQAEARLK
uniref:Vps72/YL1 C-terminal domain-containing protein n=1 Tax=Rhodosorus marinus TaxID=101924 RepID=A0A7S2ZR98_9RHOD|mmetsp:Transcript_29672/g.114239  ORF Transcript_29672/g.114239 Transcript_29672/m.114239 type:complete len:137 (+) Transcript_29672:124-534(+)|eukprot:CAMPEP_0113954768 /NCGR_PEP_ID=MMETSP0011_2-20120614/821_1 /TAXON_ID=101924 /ORGANISM="Rhodosorus marinus" /LENGTH=136 /DNA_ID=CAMNT_0000964103 /DNA_START=57 /DNA_END=467 /DNA_ORIENTATION=- /assembly_acc=CAM_ASM_000156